MRQAIAFGLNHVRGHAHGGQWGTQLMGDVGSKLPLQIAVFLQLRNLGRKLIGHVIEGRGQAAHLIVTIDGHAFLQMTSRQALCNARSRTNRRNNLLGGQPGNAHQQHHDDHTGRRKQASHQCHGGFFRLHGQCQVDLSMRDIGIGRCSYQQGVVILTVFPRSREILLRNLTLIHHLPQLIRHGETFWRGNNRAILVFHHDDRFINRLGIALLGRELAQCRTCRIDAYLHRIGGTGGINLLFHGRAGTLQLLLRHVFLLANQALSQHRNQRVGQDDHDHRGGDQNHANDARLQRGTPRCNEGVSNTP